MSRIPILDGTGIPILGTSPVRLATVPYLELVGSVVQIVRSRITSKNKNSFLYMACDGNAATFGRAGQEEDIVMGIINILKSDETARKYVLDYFNNKLKEDGKQGKGESGGSGTATDK